MDRKGWMDFFVRMKNSDDLAAKSKSTDEFVTVPASHIRGGDKIKLDGANDVYTVERCHLILHEGRIEFNLTDKSGLNVPADLHVNHPVSKVNMQALDESFFAKRDSIVARAEIYDVGSAGEIKNGNIIKLYGETEVFTVKDSHITQSGLYIKLELVDSVGAELSTKLHVKDAVKFNRGENKRKKRKPVVKPTLVSELIVGDVIYIEYSKEYSVISRLTKIDFYNVELMVPVEYFKIELKNNIGATYFRLDGKILKVIGYKYSTTSC